MMAAIGIIKGQPFKPTARAVAMLDAAAMTAFKMSRVMVYSNVDKQPGGLIYDDCHYMELTRSGAADLEWLEKSGSFRDLDLRSGVYSIIYATSFAMISVVPGQGAAICRFTRRRRAISVGRQELSTASSA